MINRTLVRTKIIQTLFAYYKQEEHSPLNARKELLRSFSDTYSLYMMMLGFADALVTYADEQIALEKKRALITHQPYEANMRFVNSRVAKQLFNNHTLRNYLTNQDLSWDAGMNAVEKIYKKLTQSKFYQEYMQLEVPSYEDEKRLWRKIYSTLLPEDPDLHASLEELELVLDCQNWNTDAELVLTYVDKTIKRFEEAKDDNQQLLEMFNSEEELSFAKDLLRLTIDNANEYKPLVADALQNWEADRIAYMDYIILITALTEIVHFNQIAIEISMNEYIELAKEYSGEKSHIFINGVLTKIINNLRKENKIFKHVK